MLSCQDISKTFGSTSVLRNASISVSAGECVLMLGPSGSGKSTLLRCLSLLQSFDSGCVHHGSKSYGPSYFDDNRHSPLSLNPSFPFMTIVFQQFHLWPHLTINDNISLPSSVSKGGVDRLSSAEIVEQFEISQLLGRYPNECSAGQRQRVALARGLVNNTKFLLLDEVTSALDRRMSKKVVDILGARKKGGMGLFIVTHDERAFEEIADKVLLLENGECEEGGNAT